MANLKGDTIPPAEGTPFGEVLQAALDSDLNDVYNTQCIGVGYDHSINVQEFENGSESDSFSGNDVESCRGSIPNCIFIMPQLGFDVSNGDTNYLERMIQLFLKMSQPLVHFKYSIIYGHSKYSLYSQGTALRRIYKILPRCYKKNLARIYVLHPTQKLRACFKVSKLFIEDKITAKVIFFKSIFRLQSLLSPVSVMLPPALLHLEDTAWHADIPPMSSLDDLFDEQLSAPPFVAKCVRYLRRRAMGREGLFRVPGDQNVLRLSSRRFRDAQCSGIVLLDPTEQPQEEQEEEEEGPQSPSTAELSSSFSDEGGERVAGEEAGGRGRQQCGVLVVDDVDEVAQLLKAYLRELPEAVITTAVYQDIVAAMREYKDELRRSEATAAEETATTDISPQPRQTGASTESCMGDVVDRVLARSMPPAHLKTLQFMLTFLADIAAMSQINKMSPDNISVVFAPTLIRVDMSTPESAMESLPICQKIVRVLLLRRMEQRVADMSPKIAFSRFEQD